MRRSAFARSLSLSLSFSLSLAVSVGGVAALAPDARAQGLQVDPRDPHKLVYNGRPIVLFGATGNDTNQSIQEIVADLDAKTARGTNFGRFWNILPWVSDTVKFPWKRTGPGLANDGLPKFDLTQWDEDYWVHVRAICQAAKDRGFIWDWQLFEDVGLENAPERWPRHPFHPNNNVNNLGLNRRSADGNGPGQFADLSNAPLLALQEAYVDRTLRELGPYGNVIFEVMNESDHSYEWGRHWIERIVRAGYIAIHNPFVDGDRFLDDRDLQAFAFHGDVTPDLTNLFMLQRYGKNKVMVSEEQFSLQYDNLMVLHIIWGALCASGTYCWDWDDARPNLDMANDFSGHAAKFFRTVNPSYAAMRPHNEKILATQLPNNEENAYCIADPGREYMGYTWTAERIEVDFTDVPAGTIIDGLWWNPQQGGVHATFTVEGGARRLLTKPDPLAWAFHFKARVPPAPAPRPTPTPTPTPNPTPTPTPTPNPNPGPAPAPAPGAGTGIGLRGEYLGGRAFFFFGPRLRLVRLDPRVDFDWGRGSPHRSIAGDGFTARWTGQVEAPTTEVYTFTTLSDDGVRLFVDGRRIVDNFTVHAATASSGAIPLVAGRKYDIRIEYFENRGNAVMKLFWETPTRPREVVPSGRLFPAR